MGEANPVQAQTQSYEQTIGGLLRGLRERSPEACSDLYDQFAPGIHQFAVTRLSGDVQTAEDVVVETMADAVRDIRRYNPRKSSLASWLFGIARRRVQMQIRRQKRRKSVPDWAQVSLESVQEAGDGGDLAATTARRLDARSKVAELRSLLSDIEMEVLVLSSIEGLSVREIERVVGRSERAVHSILHRAKTKARERLMGDDTTAW